MKKHPNIWLLGRVRRWLPAIGVLTAAQVGQALFSVFFALGSRGVIDTAVAGRMEAFFRACLTQAGIVAGMILCQTLVRHMRERLRADMERDWKQRLLHGLLHGDYAAVSASSGSAGATIFSRICCIFSAEAARKRPRDSFTSSSAI